MSTSQTPASEVLRRPGWIPISGFVLHCCTMLHYVAWVGPFDAEWWVVREELETRFGGFVPHSFILHPSAFILSPRGFVSHFFIARVPNCAVSRRIAPFWANLVSFLPRPLYSTGEGWGEGSVYCFEHVSSSGTEPSPSPLPEYRARVLIRLVLISGGFVPHFSFALVPNRAISRRFGQFRSSSSTGPAWSL